MLALTYKMVHGILIHDLFHNPMLKQTNYIMMILQNLNKDDSTILSFNIDF